MLDPNWQRGSERRRWSLMLVCLMGVLVWLAPARAKAQTCPTIQDVLQVTLAATVSYAGGSTETLNTAWTHRRTQSLQCGSPAQQVIGQPGCGRTQLPLARLLAEKVMQSMDRRVGLFDLACGNLQGTFSVGQAPFAQVSGSFSLRLRAGGSADVTLSVFVPAGPGLESLYGGLLSARETIRPAGAGAATSTGSLEIETTLGTGNVPMNVSYQFTGNRSAVLPAPITVNQVLDYDCATGSLRSELCLIASAAVPASSWPVLAMLTLMLACIAWQKVARPGHA